ncbi:hypothetical protein VNO77_41377 [Canavalia gladiata]|uniref:Secreted protein n=1 Tax=Canavalia gladiata TaxID=3824 RepID=A0AAN9PSI6_CANGL
MKSRPNHFLTRVIVVVFFKKSVSCVHFDWDAIFQVLMTYKYHFEAIVGPGVVKGLHRDGVGVQEDETKHEGMPHVIAREDEMMLRPLMLMGFRVTLNLRLTDSKATLLAVLVQ